MTHRVGPKGQVVIPKQMRDALGIEPGDDVVFEQGEDGVVVRRALPLEEIRGMCRGDGPSALATWHDHKARERALEDAREARLADQAPHA